MQSHTTVDDVREDISELKKEISKNKQVGVRLPVRSSAFKAILARLMTCHRINWFQYTGT